MEVLLMEVPFKAIIEVLLIEVPFN